MTDALFVGVDGCRKGWITSAVRKHRIIEIGFSESIQSLWRKHRNADLILIDIPIGLPRKTSRACDLEARRFLKPTSGSCVFPPPCREALQKNSYEEACTENKRITGKKISRQTWGILPKIRDVDDFLNTSPGPRKIIRESHPEVCFRALAGNPLGFSKKTPEGALERIEILKRYLVNVETGSLEAFHQHRANGAALDDILDAMVVAATAELAASRPLTLPPLPVKDDMGLPMEIVYALP